ncbi:Asp-tRNA(Asn)/Glu-tRNA(Gln) amidotransferase subunit GatA [Candidatus Woesebacteria bacterium]|nr:MAG: Asp-tRNA(Asn)/Glu-tRNA(Gln) amidotransferase subunit GatA [Candidatus Woesebacteria bacterium]
MKIPLTINETRQGLKNKDYSVVDVVNAYLDNINKHDNKLNSFITVSTSKALKKAEDLDLEIRDKGDKAFDEYPLLGVCVAHKDLYLTKGIRTTAGANVLKDYIPPYSSTVVDRLDRAGCVTLGKTNCDAWAHGASGENSDFGPTKNPWDMTRVPGGSSSGSGVAVASNFSLVATGTDTGGSIRCPANFCGVYGFKPTYGAVSRYGVVAMASSTDSMGNFSRCARDCETLFNVTKGTDGFDSTVTNFDYPIEKSANKEYVIGIPKEYFVEGIEKEVEKAVMDASKVFAENKIKLQEISLPHTKYAISVYYIIQTAEVSSNLGRYDGVRFGENRAAFSPEAKRRIMLGSYVLSSGYYDAYYLKAMKVRSKLIEDFDNAFSQVDAILAPVMPTSAFKLGEKTSNPLQMYLADILTVSANMAGIPGLAIPSGFTKNGLPLGFQLMAPRFGEATLFNLASMYETWVGYTPQVAVL